MTLTPISEDDSRHDIPDNLKLFFRPVAMTLPDMEVVAEVSLYSMGFTKVFKIQSWPITRNKYLLLNLLDDI